MSGAGDDGDGVGAGDPLADQILFTSRLLPVHKPELERLLFFNENQARVVDGVAHVAQRYGIPRIRVDGEQLRVVLATGLEPQALYVVARGELGDDPVGVMIYIREDDRLIALFVAVHEEWSARGSRGDAMIAVKLVDELKAIARRVRGVSAVEVYLGRRTPARLRVR
ncbi:MAG: hypothetical protein K1X88_11585 [Nannocystaceae bacterium]|nr:hypothetical protein [Nannocystaceae bacterium]